MHCIVESTDQEKMNMRGILKCLKKLKNNKKKSPKSTDATAGQIKLIPRSNSLGARPSSAIPLTSSLLKLATEVWDKRATIKHCDDVYALYSCIDIINPNTYARMHGLTRFFRGILFLGIEMNIKPRMQKLLNVPLEYLIIARENYVGMRLPIANAVVKRSIAGKARWYDMTNENYLVALMANSFFGFAANIRCSVTHRVYLNVKNISNKELKSALYIFGYIMREIINKINGVDSAKITTANRVDSIIIYTSSIDVSNKVIAKIQEYQNNNGVSEFSPEIPMMTEAQIYGVATASEPPEITMIKGHLLPSMLPQSFGALRAELIYNALQDSIGCSDFFELIVKYFRIAGIDASQPAIQSRHHSCLWEAQRTLVDHAIAAATKKR